MYDCFKKKKQEGSLLEQGHLLESRQCFGHLD